MTPGSNIVVTDLPEPAATALSVVLVLVLGGVFRFVGFLIDQHRRLSAPPGTVVIAAPGFLHLVAAVLCCIAVLLSVYAAELPWPAVMAAWIAFVWLCLMLGRTIRGDADGLSLRRPFRATVRLAWTDVKAVRYSPLIGAMRFAGTTDEIAVVASIQEIQWCPATPGLPAFVRLCRQHLDRDRIEREFERAGWTHLDREEAPS